MRSFLLPGLLVAFLASGCRREDPIAHYRVPKAPLWRMLAAIVPRTEETWFFKAIGPSRDLADRKEEVRRFLDSIQFIDRLPHWTLPEGWKEAGGGGERKATLKFGREGSLELAVTSLQGGAGGLLPNINRWRGQLGLSTLQESDLPRETEARQIGGVQATVVDFEGPTKPQAAPFAGGRSMPPGHPEVEPASREPFSYDLPPGWSRSENAQAGKMEFHAGGARVTITGLEGEAGGLLANVNRWRGQVGLGPVDETEMKKQVQPSLLFGGEANFIELMTSEKSILCVFTLNPTASIFVKMDGPASEVEKQKRPFLEFVGSLKVTKHG